jgi:hypothetical protein
MKRTELKVPQEPLGIVITGLPRPPQSTVFSAYVWGPAPTTPDEKAPKTA